MSCLALGLAIPTVPDVFVGPPLIPPVPIPPGDVSLLCCHFHIPDPGINVAIAVLNASIKSTLPAALLMPAIMTVNEIIAKAQAILDSVQLPDCPIE